jgi:hypothetical protein
VRLSQITRRQHPNIAAVHCSATKQDPLIEHFVKRAQKKAIVVVLAIETPTVNIPSNAGS